MLTKLTISQRGLDLIKRFEQFRSVMYNCPANHCTIGYGHLIHYGPIDGSESEKPYEHGITEPQACDLLLSDVRSKAEHYVRNFVAPALNQNQYDALCSFVFNVGGGNLQHSTLLRKLNAGDYDGAANEFLRWDMGGGKHLAGLTKRRQVEKELFCEAA